jgi:hypothetical protein
VLRSLNVNACNVAYHLLSARELETGGLCACDVKVVGKRFLRLKVIIQGGGASPFRLETCDWLWHHVVEGGNGEGIRTRSLEDGCAWFAACYVWFW